jgi:hypothetical protein
MFGQLPSGVICTFDQWPFFSCVLTEYQYRNDRMEARVDTLSSNIPGDLLR